MKILNTQQLKSMMMYMCQVMIDSQEIMCEADRNIGDGDHGIGMAKGFEAALIELRNQDFDDVYKVLFSIGRTMIKEMGGASGIIFGSLFYAGAKNKQPSATLDVDGYITIFENALEDIKLKGKAEPGDKTLVDGLYPMVEAMKASRTKDLSFKEITEIALDAAIKGKEESKQFVAKFGRAKTLGDRAIGYPDAGCVSLTLIMQALLDWLSENN